jgi:thymidylate synthase ThyX
VTYTAKILLDSVSPSGDRLTTFEVTYPRMVHSELMTHRVFSRNAASSRAIPVAKMIQRVIDDPVIPVEWGLNQAGMQAALFADDWTEEKATATWLCARDDAVTAAQQIAGLGIHKQIVNRVLEPWTWITVVITATDYSGFFAQRASRYSPLAQPELRTIADMMLALYETSVTHNLSYGDWHTPYIQDDEIFDNDSPRRSNLDRPAVEKRKQVSVARCARVSYLTQNGVRDHEKDLELYERLVSARPLHASPLEHVATPARPGATSLGNLQGWRQMRHEVEARAMYAA